MGGIGSSRPGGIGRDTVESCRSIDVNRLHLAISITKMVVTHSPLVVSQSHLIHQYTANIRQAVRMTFGACSLAEHIRRSQYTHDCI